MRRSTLYGLIGMGLVGGLGVLLAGPFSAPTNRLVGGVMLAVAVVCVTTLIVGGGGPEQRGPDF